MLYIKIFQPCKNIPTRLPLENTVNIKNHNSRPSVLWHCWWLGGRKGIRPVKNWVVGCWHGYLTGARWRLAYGSADATATHCLLLQQKSRLVLPFWYRLTWVVLEKGPLNVCSKNHNSHSSNTHKTTLYQVQLLLRMWRNQLKSTSIRFEFCISNAADSDEHLPRDHSLFHWMAIYWCLYIINTKLDDKHWSHSAFTIIQTSRISYSIGICLLQCGKRQTAINDE